MARQGLRKPDPCCHPEEHGLALTLAAGINTDVKHVTTAVFDQSGSVEARTLLEALALAAFGAVVFTPAVLRFRKQLD